MNEGISNMLLIILLLFATRGIFAFIKYDLGKYILFDRRKGYYDEISFPSKEKVKKAVGMTDKEEIEETLGRR